MQQLQDRPVSVSTPLPGATVYRPGGKVALALVFMPIAAVVGALTYFLVTASALPFWLPGVMVVWALALPLCWIALKTVRTGPSGIASGGPWQVWREISWSGIARVERRGPRLRVTGRDYTRISFNPSLLHNGTELRRFLLLRLPAEVLDDTLRDEARGLEMAASGLAYRGQLPGVFRTRPRPRLRGAAAVVTLMAMGGGALAVLKLPLLWGLPLAAGCAVVALGGLVASTWLWQRVTLSDAGLTVVGALSGRPRGMQWSHVVLLEYTPNGRVIRLTGQGQKGRVRCPGPGVMRPTGANIYRAYLKRHLRDRPVMESRRTWMW